jgi:hypothetical protein
MQQNGVCYLVSIISVGIAMCFLLRIASSPTRHMVVRGRLNLAKGTQHACIVLIIAKQDHT